MQARTLLYKAMVLSPLGFIAWMGIKGRFSSDTFQFVACTKQEQQIITAYVEPVRTMAVVDRQGVGRMSNAELTKLADAWQGHVISGAMKPIRPAEYGASLRDGVSAEILRSFHQAVAVELELARRTTEGGNHDASMDHLIRAFTMVEPIKYSDAVTVSLMGVIQRDALRRIGDHFPKVSTERRRQLIADLTTIANGGKSMEPISRHNYVLYLSWLHSKEEPLNTDSVPGTIVALASSRPRKSDQLQSQREFRLAERSEHTIRETALQLREQVRHSVVFDLKK